MEFRLTDDQRAIKESAHEYLAAHASGERLRAALDSEAGWDRALWQAMGRELGWVGAAVPERFGGLGLGYVDLATVMEETGAVLASAPFFPTAGLAAPVLSAAGDEAQQQRWLGQIAGGEAAASLCFTGASGAPAPNDVAVEAAPARGALVLNGQAHFVAFGAAADFFVVAARAAGSSGWQGLSLAVTPADAPGLSVERCESLDLTRPHARVRFNNVRVTGEAVLGGAGEAGPALQLGLARASALLAAEQVGAARRALDMSVDYAKQRVQFGRPIGSFQAIKHRLAEMLLLVESARSAAYFAACCADEDPAQLFEAASIARAYCSEAFMHCAGEAIQIHGGIGFTWEHPMHLYFKRARSAMTLLGEPAHHRELVARGLGLDRPGAQP